MTKASLAGYDIIIAQSACIILVNEVLDKFLFVSREQFRVLLITTELISRYICSPS